MSQKKEKEEKASRLTWVIPLGLLGLMVGAYFLIPSVQEFSNRVYNLLQAGDLPQFRDWISSFGAWGPVVIFITMLMQTIFAIVPSTLIIVVAIVSYGPLKGGLLAWIGLIAASLLGYAIGRSLGPHVVSRIIGRKTEETVEELVDHYGFWAIIAARVSPILSTDAVSFGAGLVKMKVYQFSAATAVGLLPLIALIGYFGADYQSMDDGLVWISGISVAIFAGYVVYDRYLRD